MMDTLKTTRPRSFESQRTRRRRGMLGAFVLVGAVLAARVAENGAAAASAQTELVSQQANDGVPLEAGEAPSISGDGQFVAFIDSHIVNTAVGTIGEVRDRSAHTLSDLPGGSVATVVSRDGCFVAFASFGQVPQVFNRCAGGAPQAVPIPTAIWSGKSVTALAISAHGRFVGITYATPGTTTLGVLLIDRSTNPTPHAELLGASEPSMGDETLTSKLAVTQTLPAGAAAVPSRVVLWDPVWSTDPAGGPPQPPSSLTTISVHSGGTPVADADSSQPSMTPDGRFVAFASAASNLTVATKNSQIYVHDVASNLTALVTKAPAPNFSGVADSFSPSITADGTQIAFETTAPNLLTPSPNAQGICDLTCTYDLLVARTTSGFFDTVAYDRQQLDPNGATFDMSTNLLNIDPHISSNGRWVAFTSGYNQALGAATLAPGTPPDTGSNVYVHGRPTALTIVPTDFGSVTVGTTSPPKTVTITNSGISSVLPASIVAANGQFVITGQTCQVNVWISPGQSCTVTATFKPSAAGTRNGTLTVAESGFQPVTGTGALSGTGLPPATIPASVAGTPAPTPAPTPPPTPAPTPPPTPAPTPPRTPAPTVPKVAKLTLDPQPAQFGQSVVGTPAAPIALVLTSTGTAPVPITNVAVDPTNPEFVITDNGCAGRTLAPTQTCVITVTFTPAGAGDRTATLTAGSTTVTATAPLDGQGIYQPTLRLSPDTVAIGQIAVAFGDKFPPSTTIQLKWTELAEVYTIITDANGHVVVQIPVRTGEQAGRRILQVLDQPTLFTPVSAPVLIVRPSLQPPSKFNPAFAGLNTLVIRG